MPCVLIFPGMRETWKVTRIVDPAGQSWNFRSSSDRATFLERVNGNAHMMRDNWWSSARGLELWDDCGNRESQRVRVRGSLELKQYGNDDSLLGSLWQICLSRRQYGFSRQPVRMGSLHGGCRPGAGIMRLVVSLIVDVFRGGANLAWLQSQKEKFAPFLTRNFLTVGSGLTVLRVVC